jgi:UDP-glucose 4-epimerase
VKPDLKTPAAGPVPGEGKAKLGRTLVTGISGGLGRILLRRLLAAGRTEVVGVARKPIPDVRRQKVEFHELDLAKRRIEDVFRQKPIDAVVHLAFEDDPTVSSRERMKTNVLGLMRLLDCCEKHGVKKVVVLSTASVYGALPDNPALLTEDMPARADLLHGGFRDRVEADRYAQAWMWRNPHVATVVLRPVHIVGREVRNSFLAYLRLRVVPTLLGFSPMMQVIHEEDAARAVELALEREGATGVFNIVGPGAVPLHEILRAVGAEVLPLPHLGTLGVVDLLHRLGVVPFPARQADFLRYSLVVSGEKARRELGFQAEVPLRETLASVSGKWA